MNEVINDLSEAIRQQLESFTVEINNAGSMILTIKSGAQAWGFVQGLVSAGGITAKQGDALSEYFDNLIEQRLRTLTLGLP